MIFTKDILDFLFAQYVIYVLHSACLDGLYSVITCAPLIGCDARGDDHVMTLSCSDFYTFFPFFCPHSRHLRNFKFLKEG